jgi:hypothetical protein
MIIKPNAACPAIKRQETWLGAMISPLLDLSNFVTGARESVLDLEISSRLKIV